MTGKNITRNGKYFYPWQTFLSLLKLIENQIKYESR
jgi:hypothetical protein